jgi:hypothetical protein
MQRGKVLLDMHWQMSALSLPMRAAYNGWYVDAQRLPIAPHRGVELLTQPNTYKVKAGVAWKLK